MIVTRFAPSPTGRLHLGHAFSALKAHDFARGAGGRFLLRIEDIDGTRSRRDHIDTILRDLDWLGIGWDGAVSFQSRRLAYYHAALQELRARGLIYPCFCTRADIAASTSAPHGPEGPLYPGTCRGLARPDLSRPHCWRLDMATAARGGLTFTDTRHGVTAADPAQHGDVVLARKDAPASYHLAVTLDDAAQGVTDVVRGADLLPATHVHRLLQALLGLPTPRYHHHELLTGPDGERLAKRHGAPTLAALREAGADGHALADALRRGELPVGFAAARD
ncbi:tRNA glutamyl-Q(34) synthetase GluQRS [Sphingomonas sp.]|uniref:tRNA glutamyl-Q(34) synthetase GluQRS n=1 Tax=Sphingomonas sp. TaxID=28214 RepID=UPI001EBF9878|nr:tRNA glutamyl-Q(34) synthetase GluQRS [Sphingomonas sp.]MBX3594939.1 tRNA glutamyl-Q(34) synthetase GluQRS [Sphingomonas sp.]